MARHSFWGCVDGVHRPLPKPVPDADGVLRSVCRDCGCSLVKPAPSRRWYASAVLG